MKKDEIRGLLKGIGVATVICSAIFYTMLLNYKVVYSASEVMTEDIIIEKARSIGMIFPTEFDINNDDEETSEKEEDHHSLFDL